eukprot:scaffold955_cov325-Prasinococcus_capsulatus_cf.AAC.7
MAPWATRQPLRIRCCATVRDVGVHVGVGMTNCLCCAVQRKARGAAQSGLPVRREEERRPQVAPSDDQGRRPRSEACHAAQSDPHHHQGQDRRQARHSLRVPRRAHRVRSRSQEEAQNLVCHLSPVCTCVALGTCGRPQPCVAWLPRCCSTISIVTTISSTSSNGESRTRTST